MATRLPELRNLLERIWSGELKHKQSKIYSDCGTAACVVGWDFALDFCDGDLKRASKEPCEEPPWEYTKQKYGLTDAEAMLLLGAASTKNLQKATLQALELGRSISTDDMILMTSCNYTGTVKLLAMTSKEAHSIQSFFEGFEYAYKFMMVNNS